MVSRCATRSHSFCLSLSISLTLLLTPPRPAKLIAVHPVRDVNVRTKFYGCLSESVYERQTFHIFIIKGQPHGRDREKVRRLAKIQLDLFSVDNAFNRCNISVWNKVVDRPTAQQYRLWTHTVSDQACEAAPVSCLALKFFIVDMLRCWRSLCGHFCDAPRMSCSAEL